MDTTKSTSMPGSSPGVHSPAGAAYPIAVVPAAAVELTDELWSRRLETNRKTTIPRGFAKCEEEGRMRNFERAAGQRGGPYEGAMPFDDTDVYKLIEGAAQTLVGRPDPELDQLLDTLIVKIAAGMEPDGYLTTYKTIDPTVSPAPWAPPGPRWEGELNGSHELYNAGHLYEAAYAHQRATGKRNLLEVALRNAELVARTFRPGGRLTPPGHQVIETGLIKLAELTGDGRFVALARFFLEQRGDARGHVLGGEVIQDHLPVTEQREAVGHAVRAVYMYAAMADIAAIEGEPRYLAAVEALWEDVVKRKLYLTGGIGARHDGEAFGAPFELPNRTAYAETCAAIGSVYWNHRLFRLTGDGRYVDLLERTLYNAVLAGVSLTGDAFFYPNVLEWDGKGAFNRGTIGRQPWFDCSCCPTSMARFLPVVPELIYAAAGPRLFVNLFVASRASLEVQGVPLRLEQTTRYPWEGRVELRLLTPVPIDLELWIRLPGFTRGRPVGSDLYAYLEPAAATPTLRVNGGQVTPAVERGYAVVTRRWQPGDVVTVELPLPVQRVVADERVTDNRGRVALERGPIVYCAEAVDNDGAVLDLVLPDHAEFEAVYRPDLLAGVVTLEGDARSSSGRARKLVAVPYSTWANRELGEMAIWLRRAPRQAGAGLPNPSVP